MSEKKRKLIDELLEGVDSMRRQREGKVTLRTHKVQERPPLSVGAETIRETREQLEVSRAVFARRLRVRPGPWRTGSRNALARLLSKPSPSPRIRDSGFQIGFVKLAVALHFGLGCRRAKVLVGPPPVRTIFA